MKKYLTIISGIVAFAMVTTLSAQTTHDGLAKVVSLKGAARYMAVAGGDWKPIKVGLVLKPGAVVQTAADSYVDVVLNNAKASQGLGSALSDEPTSINTPNTTDGGYKPKAMQDAIRIFENTVMSLDKLTITKTGADIVSETQLDLKAGRIFGTVKKLSEASVYEIKIPNGVAGIRGTIYLISADGNVSVLTGAVVISFVSGGVVVTKEVPAGYQFDPVTGLVTPISDPGLRVLVGLAQLFSKYLPNIPGTTYIFDNTLYNVSPVTTGGSIPSSTGGNTGVGDGDGAPPR